jgi:hypothetical protein
MADFDGCVPKRVTSDRSIFSRQGIRIPRPYGGQPDSPRDAPSDDGLIDCCAVCYDTDLAFGPLAQLGERLVRNQEVGGSSPPRSTNLRNRGRPGVSQG